MVSKAARTPPAASQTSGASLYSAIIDQVDAEHFHLLVEHWAAQALAQCPTQDEQEEFFYALLAAYAASLGIAQ